MRLLKNVIMAFKEEVTYSYSFECLHEFKTICDQNILNSRNKLYDINSEPPSKNDVI